MITGLRTEAASRPAVDLLLRAVAIAIVALAIGIGLPFLAALAG